jgi:hypothetical protein
MVAPVANPLPEEYRAPERVTPLLAGILTTTHERHVDMINLIRDLPDDALTWRPGPAMSSLAGLVRHVMDDETQFVRSVAGMPNGWPGSNGKWMDAAGTAAELVALIADGDALLKAVYPGLSAAQMRLPHPAIGTPIGQELVQAADHCAMHYGHMQITRHLYELAHPDFVSGYHHWR